MASQLRALVGLRYLAIVDANVLLVEVTFAVPVSWTAGNNAIMTQCVIDAMTRAELGVTQGSPTPNLFMVNEAEAAAIYALDSGLHYLNVRAAVSN